MPSKYNWHIIPNFAYFRLYGNIQGQNRDIIFQKYVSFNPEKWKEDVYRKSKSAKKLVLSLQYSMKFRKKYASIKRHACLYFSFSVHFFVPSWFFPHSSVLICLFNSNWRTTCYFMYNIPMYFSRTRYRYEQDNISEKLFEMYNFSFLSANK